MPHHGIRCRGKTRRRSRQTDVARPRRALARPAQGVPPFHAHTGSRAGCLTQPISQNSSSLLLLSSRCRLPSSGGLSSPGCELFACSAPLWKPRVPRVRCRWSGCTRLRSTWRTRCARGSLPTAASSPCCRRTSQSCLTGALLLTRVLRLLELQALIDPSCRSERGAWFALDLGGTNFRVLRLSLSDAAGSIEDVKVRPPPRLRCRSALGGRLSRFWQLTRLLRPCAPRFCAALLSV